MVYLLKVNGAEFELGRLRGRQLGLQLLQSGVIYTPRDLWLHFSHP